MLDRLRSIRYNSSSCHASLTAILSDFACRPCPKGKRYVRVRRRQGKKHCFCFKTTLKLFTDVRIAQRCWRQVLLNWIWSGCIHKNKAASHRIRLRLTIRLMANGSLHTTSVGRIRVNFLGLDRLPAYLKLFKVTWIAGVVGDGVLAACGKTAVGHKPDRKP